MGGTRRWDAWKEKMKNESKGSSMTTGILYGIGVGPGDPELLPLKAVRILGRVAQVFTAASTKNDYSLAMEIVRPHIPETTAVERLDFPMSKERGVMEAAWRRHAARIAAVLEEGRSAAFLTLGDPLTYSTYGYILRHLQADWPHLAVCTVPGITSYQAAAAATNRPLVEGEEALLIVSGVHGGQRLLDLDRQPENVVFMKAYRNMPSITAALETTGMLAGSLAVTNCSREDERIHLDPRALEQLAPNYWTLIIAKRNGHGTQE
jgi:precorrin-2/cobalt-factor-2 C20-methyltransferase